MKTKKELFLITFLAMNWSLVIKITCVGKEQSQNNSDTQIASLTVCIHVKYE